MSLGYPGFADPVLDSQAAFRAVLDAMSRPGTIHAVAGPADPPPPLHRATAAVVLTLVDAETPLWLDPAAEAAAEWIAFHCGAPCAGQASAVFALALAPMPLDALAAGSDDGPEDGATLVWQVAALGSGRRFTLRGPGLPGPAAFQADLPADFPVQWRANSARFPRGVDLVLCAGDRIAAFPRTLHLEPG